MKLLGSKDTASGRPTILSAPNGGTHGTHTQHKACLNAVGCNGWWVNDWWSKVEPNTLLADINASATTITAAQSISSWGTTGAFWLGAEKITYTGKSGNSFTGCTRGAVGSPAAHTVDEPISDWSHIDAEIARAEDVSNWTDGLRKVLGLRIFMGEKAPAWATAGCPLNDPASGGFLPTPMPWHQKYLSNNGTGHGGAKGFMARLAARYNTSGTAWQPLATIVAVRVSNIGTNAAEPALEDDKGSAALIAAGHPTLTSWHYSDMWDPNGASLPDAVNFPVYSDALFLAAMKDVTAHAASVWPNVRLMMSGNNFGFTTSGDASSTGVYNDFGIWVVAQVFREQVMFGWTEIDNVRPTGGSALVSIAKTAVTAATPTEGTCWDAGFSDEPGFGQADVNATMDELLGLGPPPTNDPSYPTVVNCKPIFFDLGPSDDDTASKHTWWAAIDQTLFAGVVHA